MARPIVCSDMWQPYLAVLAERISQAIHIFDRLHIMTHLSKALDLVRASEAREMKRQGLEPVLTGSRWCLLKRAANLTVMRGRQRAVKPIKVESDGEFGPMAHRRGLGEKVM